MLRAAERRLEPPDHAWPRTLLACFPLLWSRVLFPGADQSPARPRWLALALLVLLPAVLLYPRMSFHLLETYKKSRADEPLAEVLSDASKAIASKGISQEPQITPGGFYEKNPAKATLRDLLSDSPGDNSVQPQVAPPPPTLPGSQLDKIQVKLVGLDSATAQSLQQGIDALAYAQTAQANENRAVVKDAQTGKTSLVSADGVPIVDVTGQEANQIQRTIDPYLVQAYLFKKLARRAGRHQRRHPRTGHPRARRPGTPRAPPWSCSAHPCRMATTRRRRRQTGQRPRQTGSRKQTILLGLRSS